MTDNTQNDSEHSVENKNGITTTRRGAMASGAAVLPMFSVLGGSDSLGVFDNFWVADSGEDIEIDPDRLNFADGLTATQVDDGIDVAVVESLLEDDSTDDDGGDDGSTSSGFESTTFEEDMNGDPITPTSELDLEFMIAEPSGDNVIYDSIYSVTLAPLHVTNTTNEGVFTANVSTGINNDSATGEEDVRFAANVQFEGEYLEDTEISVTILHDADLDTDELAINPENADFGGVS